MAEIVLQIVLRDFIVHRCKLIMIYISKLTAVVILIADTLIWFIFSPFQLVDASTLKKEVAEGVDLMVVRELTGGECNILIHFSLSGICLF